MVRMLAPEGVTQVSVEQQVFDVDKEGFVTVPTPFVGRLKDIGFKHGPFSATVSTAAAQAIRNTAAAKPQPPAVPAAEEEDGESVGEQPQQHPQPLERAVPAGAGAAKAEEEDE